MPDIELTLLLGRYAIDWHLNDRRGTALAETVSDWREHLRLGVVPLPHPSPRNIRWFKTNAWFEADLIPVLRLRIDKVLK
jgi:uracil-DNA glycosylase